MNLLEHKLSDMQIRNYEQLAELQKVAINGSANDNAPVTMADNVALFVVVVAFIFTAWAAVAIICDMLDYFFAWLVP